MTPPATLETLTRPTRASRSAAPPPAEWRCDNCTQPNAARRRRCVECGTSRC